MMKKITSAFSPIIVLLFCTIISPTSEAQTTQFQELGAQCREVLTGIPKLVYSAWVRGTGWTPAPPVIKIKMAESPLGQSDENVQAALAAFDHTVAWKLPFTQNTTRIEQIEPSAQLILRIIGNGLVMVNQSLQAGAFDLTKHNNVFSKTSGILWITFLLPNIRQALRDLLTQPRRQLIRIDGLEKYFTNSPVPIFKIVLEGTLNGEILVHLAPDSLNGSAKSVYENMIFPLQQYVSSTIIQSPTLLPIQRDRALSITLTSDASTEARHIDIISHFIAQLQALLGHPSHQTPRRLANYQQAAQQALLRHLQSLALYQLYVSIIQSLNNYQLQILSAQGFDADNILRSLGRDITQEPFRSLEDVQVTIQRIKNLSFTDNQVESQNMIRRALARVLTPELRNRTPLSFQLHDDGFPIFIGNLRMTIQADWWADFLCSADGKRCKDDLYYRVNVNKISQNRPIFHITLESSSWVDIPPTLGDVSKILAALQSQSTGMRNSNDFSPSQSP